MKWKPGRGDALDAMILAAGLGTRLAPVTDTLPKALVPVGGTPMLERIARRLVKTGVDRIIVNVHHHADQIRRFIEEQDGFGVDIRISEEADAPLETGGGVLHARAHFRGDAPFFVHNVDVLSDMDLEAMYAEHDSSTTLATLAVSDRPSSRRLVFDEGGLYGRVDLRSDRLESVRPPVGASRSLAFAGIHVISPGFFDLLDEAGAFSIMTPYLRLAAAGHTILPYDTGAALWLEVGDPERLERARRFVRGDEVG
jgi:N-acetyl-alpha-D-muramate 1-phosphate uridylyltransferase